MAYASSHTNAQRRSPLILADATVEYESSLAAMWHALRAAKAACESDVESNSSVVQDLLNARYNEGSRGQFLSEGPVFWADPKAQLLMDPQSFNTYSYSEDNPIVREDPMRGHGRLGVKSCSLSSSPREARSRSSVTQVRPALAEPCSLRSDAA
jgi:hypothetical protein